MKLFLAHSHSPNPFDLAGVDLLLLQCSPQLEEMERLAAAVIQKTGHLGGILSGVETP